MTQDIVRIPPVWCGPDGIGQGGVTGGLLAATVTDGPVDVRLHAPAPLDRDLHVRRHPGGGEATLVDPGGRTIATARSIAAIDGTAPPVADLATARSVTGTLNDRNPIARCVVCGREREDGLRVWPGPRPDGPGVAAAFTVPTAFRDGDGALARPFVFGALDCTSGFAVVRESAGGFALTGSLQVQIDGPVPAGAPVIGTAAVAGRGRRTWLVDAALWSAGGDVLARTRATWVDVDPSLLG
ncbi:MAG TPA: hypothetical protein VK875_03715 [Euzebyales bacterium]|nr:hypothetical protein [Euzebyales bacterium]